MVIIPNEAGDRTTPSYVAFNETKRLVGEAAKNQATSNPTNTIFGVKRLIGRKASDQMVQEDMKKSLFKVVAGSHDKPKIIVKYKNEDIEFAPEEISSMILTKMKDIAETFLGSKVEKVVITVPAYFNDSQRKSTKDDAVIAGLEVLHMINEPTAAAIAYTLDKRADVDGKMNVLVFDLGGGTFDVSILTIDKGGLIEVKATGGDTHLGGEDFDNRMVGYFVREFQRKHKKDISKNLKALGRLRDSCERAKRFISTDSKVSIDIPCLSDAIDFSARFTRAKFEEVNMDLFTKCMDIVKTYLRDVNMSTDSIDEVVLVGGSTRICKIQELLKELFNGKVLYQRTSPDEAVACGAGMLAAKLSGMGNEAVQAVEVIDVTPLSLGVSTLNDAMVVLIPKGSPIPTKTEHTFCIGYDNQTRMALSVYQGERSKSIENFFLSEFWLSGLPRAAGRVVKVVVCFEIDANGILHASAREITTRRKNVRKMTNTGSLSKSEIKKMIKDVERYKLEDETRMKKVIARNALADFVYKTRAKIKDDNFRVKRSREMRLSVKDLEEIDHQIEEAIEWLDEHPNAEIVDLENKEEELNKICKRTKLKRVWKD
ncbi:putative Heat shock protein 70 family [Helianthus annuus]|nr:putative Heat shock protein 70 family [Helianthus annuus]